MTVSGTNKRCAQRGAAGTSQQRRLSVCQAIQSQPMDRCRLSSHLAGNSGSFLPSFLLCVCVCVTEQQRERERHRIPLFSKAINHIPKRNKEEEEEGDDSTTTTTIKSRLDLFKALSSLEAQSSCSFVGPIFTQKRRNHPSRKSPLVSLDLPENGVVQQDINHVNHDDDSDMHTMDGRHTHDKTSTELCRSSSSPDSHQNILLDHEQQQ